MGRRRRVRQDSLEMLLDTICNTFGGVLFIAILVVLLLQQTEQGQDVSEASPPPEELQALGQKLTSLSRELTRQQEIRASQEAIVGGFVPEAVQELLSRRRQLLAEQVQKQAEVDQRRAENAGLAARVEQTLADNRQLDQDLERTIAERKQLQSQLDSERKTRTQQVRLPVLRSRAGKREVAIIIRYGRVYLWHEYDRLQNRNGLNIKDFVVVEEDADKLVTRPNPTRGIRLDKSDDTEASIRRLLEPFDPQQFYLATVVRPDSFGEFKHFRDRVLILGFEYRLLPVEDDSPISDTGGSGSQVQ